MNLQIKLISTSVHLHPEYLTAGWQIPFLDRMMNIGRMTFNELILPFKTVSSIHARLYSDNGQLYIEDLGSTNGTYCNGHRMYRGQVTYVSSETKVQFGDILTQLSLQASTVPPPTTGASTRYSGTPHHRPALFR